MKKQKINKAIENIGLISEMRSLQSGVNNQRVINEGIIKDIFSFISDLNSSTEFGKNFGDARLDGFIQGVGSWLAGVILPGVSKGGELAGFLGQFSETIAQNLSRLTKEEITIESVADILVQAIMEYATEEIFLELILGKDWDESDNLFMQAILPGLREFISDYLLKNEFIENLRKVLIDYLSGIDLNEFTSGFLD